MSHRRPPEPRERTPEVPVTWRGDGRREGTCRVLTTTRVCGLCRRSLGGKAAPGRGPLPETPLGMLPAEPRALLSAGSFVRGTF